VTQRDRRTHLQEILGGKVSELSESSARVLIDFVDNGRPNAHLLTVGQARQRYDADCIALGPGEPITEINEHHVMVPDAAVAVREFRPRSGVLPAIVYLHGGGWLLGSIDSHQAVCSALANASGCVVFSVGYRLGPESRFPAAVEDCYAVLEWVQARADALSIDPGRIAVAGDSAGGNLATVVAILSRDRGGPRLTMQVLVYPVTTTDLSVGFDLGYDGFLLYRDELQWHQDNYLPAPEQKTDPHVSPLDHGQLARLPDTLIITAQCDPLHAQGELYARALEAAGVAVEHREWRGALHGFFQFPQILTEGAEAVSVAASALKRQFAEPLS